MKKQAFLAFVLVMLLLSSCGLKELVGPNAESYTRSDSYQPVTDKSTWRYNVTAFGVSDVKTVVMGANTVVFDGRTYNAAKITQQSDGSTDNEYYYHSGNVYTTRADAASPDDVVEEQYLDDTSIIGTTFISKPNALGTSGGVPVRYLGTVIDRNATKTIGKFNFKNVIHTQVDLQYNTGNGFITNTTYDYYVSRGIGIIEIDASSAGVVYASETIAAYYIR